MLVGLPCLHGLGIDLLTPSAFSQAVAGQFNRSLKYSLHLDTIAGFSVSICEPSVSLIGATAVFVDHRPV